MCLSSSKAEPGLGQVGWCSKCSPSAPLPPCPPLFHRPWGTCEGLQSFLVLSVRGPHGESVYNSQVPAGLGVCVLGSKSVTCHPLAPLLPGLGRSCLLSQSLHVCWFIYLFFKDFISLFLERGARREKERERNINVWLPLMCPLLGTWPATQACALTGN